MHEEHTVVIVGAGPTGLALAAELKRLGIDSLLLERLATGASTSRAAAIHARTLEVLEPLGVTADLLREGIITSTFCIRDKDQMLASISFKGLKTKYPFVLICPQDRTEDILLKKLKSLKGVIERPCEVVSIRPGAKSVEVQYKSDKGLKTVHAKWVVGCDGMHSIVREMASIPFEGGHYEENFVLADVEMDWSLGREQVNMFFSEKGIVGAIPLPKNLFRLIATVNEALPSPTMEDFQKILNERGPKTTIHRVVWSSRFHIHHRVAKVLRKGRIILAGDSGHVHSPAGGQGMNTGIQDAITLAAALKKTMETGDDTILDLWQHKRLKIARGVVRLTDRLTKVITVSSPIAKMIRNAIIFLIGKIPFVQHILARRLSELDNR